MSVMTTLPAFTVVENTAVGTALFTVGIADEDAGDVLRFALLGSSHPHNGSVYAIDASTGVIRVAGVVNYEAGTVMP